MLATTAARSHGRVARTFVGSRLGYRERVLMAGLVAAAGGGGLFAGYMRSDRAT